MVVGPGFGIRPIENHCGLLCWLDCHWSQGLEGGNWLHWLGGGCTGAQVEAKGQTNAVPGVAEQGDEHQQNGEQHSHGVVSDGQVFEQMLDEQGQVMG